MLMDWIHIDADTLGPNASHWILALGVILEKYLMVRMCLNELVARRIVQENSNCKQFLIWYDLIDAISSYIDREVCTGQ